MLPITSPPSDSATRQPPSFAKRAVIIAATVLSLWLLWRLLDVVILVFGSIVFAVALRGLARRVTRHLHVPERVSVPVSVLIVLGVLAAVGWFVGDALAEQLVSLRERLPQAWQQFQTWLGQNGMGRQVLATLRDLGNAGLSMEKVASAAGLTLGALGSALLTVILAVYLAADPRLYLEGLVRLFPAPRRAPLRSALEHSGEGLARWLVGQALSMIFLGTTTALGLWAVQAPLALALGLITGLLCFVPFFGAIIAGVISVLVAFTEGPDIALYVALLFLGIQQLEEYLVTPFVQRWAVSLPPAMAVVSALVFGILFGPLGVVFATPLMVVAMILVNQLYVPNADRAGQP